MHLTRTTQNPNKDQRHQEPTDDQPANLWQRSPHGWPASYPVIQVPNAPLALALLTMLAAALASGDLGSVLTAISRVALGVWAYQELVDGGNAFRRLLGLGFLVYLVTVLSAAHR